MLEWIIRAIDQPYLVEIDEEHPGRQVYPAYIPEYRGGRWLLVVVQDDHLFISYFNREDMKRYGRPAS